MKSLRVTGVSVGTIASGCVVVGVGVAVVGLLAGVAVVGGDALGVGVAVGVGFRLNWEGSFRRGSSFSGWCDCHCRDGDAYREASRTHDGDNYTINVARFHDIYYPALYWADYY